LPVHHTGQQHLHFRILCARHLEPRFMHGRDVRELRHAHGAVRARLSKRPVIDFAHRFGCAIGVEEHGLIRRRRLGKLRRRARRRIAARQADQLAGGIGSQEMCRIELAAADIAAKARAHLALRGLGIFARHQRADVGILAQIEDGLLLCCRGVVAAFGILGDCGGKIAQPVLVAMLLHQAQPGLIDELKQAGGRRGARLGIGL
jgi:hypothetical protein